MSLASSQNLNFFETAKKDVLKLSEDKEIESFLDDDGNNIIIQRKNNLHK